MKVQYWNGSSCTDVTGGNISGNNKVWRKITFAALTTNKIRVLTNASADDYCRIQELEAWTTTAGSSSAQYWLVSDQLGTPRMIVDDSGSLAITSRHDYLTFGPIQWNQTPRCPGLSEISYQPTPPWA